MLECRCWIDRKFGKVIACARNDALYGRVGVAPGCAPCLRVHLPPPTHPLFFKSFERCTGSLTPERPVCVTFRLDDCVRFRQGRIKECEHKGGVQVGGTAGSVVLYSMSNSTCLRF
eukprot:1017358-Amorphochlora_amoeboformis.AAC.1